MASEHDNAGVLIRTLGWKIHIRTIDKVHTIW